MNDSNGENGDWAVRNKKNTARLSYWTLAWVVTMAAAAFGPKLVWDFATVPTIVGRRFVQCRNSRKRGTSAIGLSTATSTGSCGRPSRY